MEDEPVDRSATLGAPLSLECAGDAREDTVQRERALDRFLAGIERRAIRIAQMALRDRAEAEDAVQDAMIRLVRHYARRPEGEWRPLFYRILRNRITDFQRRQKLRRAVMVLWSGSERGEGGGAAPDPLESVADSRSSPDALAEGEELLRRIEAVLATLSSRQRDAFLLRNFEGLDVAQAALAMGCSEGSVKTHYFRAMQALQGALGDLQT
jgi:RNA polymerase sigma-70 factor (ECF subfamily)